MVWREQYAYDANGNRASKITPWGTISYAYDSENRLIKKGDIAYTYDRDGNLLSEKGLRREAWYKYNGQDRMVYSEITSHAEKSRATSRYAYDALGRRTVSQDAGGSAMRTLYDGLGFEVLREGETFNDGSFTTRYSGDTEAKQHGDRGEPLPVDKRRGGERMGAEPVRGRVRGCAGAVYGDKRNVVWER
jgi:YD repeat-containing protein